MVRMQDIAKEAGVSLTTVSHVVNATRRVKPQTLQKVQAAMDALGYQPNAIAKSLRRGKTLTIGVLVTDISNPFFSELVRGIEDTVRNYGYSVIQGSSDEDPRRQDQYLRLFTAQQVDGLIIVPAGEDSTMLRTLQERDLPIVSVDRRPMGLNGPWVGIDNVAAAEQAVSHLLDHGHERIGIVTGLHGLSTSEERRMGYYRAYKKHHLTIDKDLIKEGDSRVASARRHTHELLALADPPTALVPMNNLMTLGTLLALREAQVHCPKDIALIGFDDHVWAELLTPPLTVVRQPIREIGNKAAELLVACLCNGMVSDDPALFPTELVIRGSCSEDCAKAYARKSVRTRA